MKNPKLSLWPAVLSLSMLTPTTGLANHGSACGPAVSWKGHLIRVVPVDAAHDTANLQCAFDLASASPGSVIELAEGTFISGVLFIHDFVGEVRGEGESKTVVTSSPGIQVNPDWWNSGQPPGTNNVYPQLWTFTEGRFSMRDLTFRAPLAPASEWFTPGVPVPITAFLAQIAITGQNVRAEFTHLTFEAAPDPADPFYGFSSYSSVLFAGFPWGPEFPMPAVSGDVRIRECHFKSTAEGLAPFNVTDSHLTVVDNQYDDVFTVVDPAGVRRSTVLYSGNRARNAVQAILFDLAPGVGFDSSLLIVHHNDYQVSTGLLIDTTFTGASACVITDNRIDPESAGITLGTGTSRCLVAHNHGATVTDNGTGNHVVP